MNEENDQLPLARMATISRPSFWIYFGVCAVLFACTIFREHEPFSGWMVPALIAIGIFVVLFIELLIQHTKSEKTAKLLINISYILEAGSALVFLYLVFQK